MKLSLIAGVVMASVLLVGCNKAPTPNAGTVDNTEAGANAVLAQCLTDNGLKMYGTEWCSHCKEQKSRFGADFAKVTYIDCDAQKQVCMDNGIQGYPTRKDKAGNFFPGVQSLEKLAEIGGCQAGSPAPVPAAQEEAPKEEIPEAWNPADDLAGEEVGTPGEVE